MLDLTLQKDLYEIKWLDGEVLKLKAPTQKQFVFIKELQETKTEPLKVLDLTYEIVNSILNDNTRGRKIDATELSLDTCVLILQDYFEFYHKEIQKNVFFQPTLH